MIIQTNRFVAAALSPALLALASCGAFASVDKGGEELSIHAAQEADQIGPFKVTEHGKFNEPWAAAFEPETGRLFITEKSGALKYFNPETGAIGTVTGVPKVDYGGQGGFGDIAFAPDYSSSGLIYLSWVEAGNGKTRGAVVGMGKLACQAPPTCAISDLRIIWRQTPKVTGKGHYSHRIAISPDGQHLFIASGDRQKKKPAQNTTNNLGSILRLNLDGSPAVENPLSDRPSPTNQIWSYGHRNILGLGFDAEGRLWDVEHGPAGGDEFNLVESGANYGWPMVSDGNHYGGKKIPNNVTRPDLAQSAITWSPVIAPGGMIFYRGDMFAGWKGSALIAGLSSNALVHVKLNGDAAREIARYDFGERLRAVAEAPDGAIWLLEDGKNGKLLRLTPA